MVTGVVPRCRFTSEDVLEGGVVAIDRFGNLLTNIDRDAIEQLQCRFPGSGITVQLAKHRIRGIASVYQERNQGTLLAILGSRGLLEISVNGGSAHHLLGDMKSDAVRVRVSP
jgi:S-adenosylmethionine hydrolase